MVRTAFRCGTTTYVKGEIEELIVGPDTIHPLPHDFIINGWDGRHSLRNAKMLVNTSQSTKTRNHVTTKFFKKMNVNTSKSIDHRTKIFRKTDVNTSCIILIFFY